MARTAGLTDKQRRFAEEMAQSGNQTQAAIRAGYAEKSAPQTGMHLMRKPEVRSLVASLQREQAAQAGVTGAAVVRRLWQIASENKPDRVSALAQLRQILPDLRPDAAPAAQSQHLHLHGVALDDLRAIAERVGIPRERPPGTP